ncbi:MAG TPA: YraN family protein [Candidatus Dojkabacteria bacterium]|nr:YraN family protein [Candidatus Dojkabacteria bacterium]HQF36581.1 YraN family protein [Candidatus Dojkabacteria bacterium]
MHRNCIGAIGEDLILNRFLAKGGILLGKNIYSRYGEIDLLMLLKNTIYIIEVKTTEVNYNNVSLVTACKVQKLYRTFEYFCIKNSRFSVNFLDYQYVFYSIDLEKSVRFVQYFLN